MEYVIKDNVKEYWKHLRGVCDAECEYCKDEMEMEDAAEGFYNYFT